MCSSSVLNVASKVIRALCRSGWLVVGRAPLVLCIRSSVFLMERAMLEVWVLVGLGVPFLHWRVWCLLREEYPIPDEKGMC